MANCPNCGTFTGNGNHCGSCAPFTGNQDPLPGSVNKKGCFVGATRILCSTGEKPISDLSAGDKVVAFSKNGCIPRFRNIIRKEQHGKRRIWQVSLTDGSELRTTCSHSFLTPQGWMRADQLFAGAVVVKLDKGLVVHQACVEYVGETNQYEDVYNLIVEKEHTFVAEGHVVHSFSYFRSLRTALSNIRFLVTNTKPKKRYKETKPA